MPVRELRGHDEKQIEAAIQAQSIAKAKSADVAAMGTGEAIVDQLATNVATSIGSKVRRLGVPIPGGGILSEDADTLNRLRGATSQAMQPKYEGIDKSFGYETKTDESGKTVDAEDYMLPKWLRPGSLSRNAVGVASNLPEMAIAGATGGTLGMAGYFGLGSANEAYTQAKDAGLSEQEAIAHARNQGLIEAGVTLGFSAAGKLVGSSALGGAETIVANAAKAGTLGSPATKQALKKTIAEGAKSLSAEQAEELTIGVLTAAQDVYSGVDPNATQPERLLEMAQDTFLQTLGTMGAVGGAAKAAQMAARSGSQQAAAPTAETTSPTTEATADPTAEAVDDAQETDTGEVDEDPADVTTVLGGLFADGPKTQGEVEQALEDAGFDLNDPDTLADVNSALDAMLADGYEVDEASGTIRKVDSVSPDTQQPDFMRDALIQSGMDPDIINEMDDDGVAAMYAALENHQLTSMGIGAEPDPETESVPQAEADASQKGGDPDGVNEVVRQEEAEQAQGTIEPEGSSNVAVGDRPEPNPVTETQPPQFESYEQFAKAYRDAFKQMMKYTENQVGSREWAQRMADMADAHPDWADQVENEPEPQEGSPAPVVNEVSPPTDAIGEETPQETGTAENIESTEPEAPPHNQQNQTGAGEQSQAEEPAPVPMGNKPKRLGGGKKKEAVEETENPSDGTDPDLSVASQVKSLLDSDGDLTSESLFSIADKAYGGTRAEGKYGDSRAYDALELGVNQHLVGKTNPNVDEATAIETVGAIDKLASKLPRHKARTGNKDTFQQFSTPPSYAYAVNWIAGIQPSDTVLEPSAGNGGIAVHAKNAGSRVAVNEIDPSRARNAKSLGFDEVYQEDAEQIDGILKGKLAPTVVVMNPPFSRAGNRMGGKMVVGTDRKHIQSALNLMPDGGRLVAIVGAGLHGQSKGMTDWLADLPFAVRANVDVAREVYRGYGTEFPTRVLVIDKVPKSDAQTVTGSAGSIPELISLLKDVRNDRPAIGEQSQSEPAPAISEESAPEAEGADSGGKPVRDATDSMGDGKPVGESVQQARPVVEPSRERGGNAESQTGGTAATTTGSSGRKLGGGKSGKRSKPTEPVGPADASLKTDRKLGNESRSVKAESVSAQDKKVKELTDSTYETYRPSVRIPGAKKHPASIVESAAMSAVGFPKVDYEISIPEKTLAGYTNEDGLQVGISDLQLEVVAAAGHAHSQMLPDGERRGFMVGDGTGVGKAREAAGIIMDNWNKGRRKAVWLTKNTKLAPQAVDEWQRIGGKADDVFMQADIGSGEAVGKGDGILFSTYPTITQTASTTAASNGKTLSRLDQIVNWVGEDFDGVIVFDEAHQMGEAEESGEGINKKKASQRALAGVDLQARLPNARVVYMSATSATEVRNLAYAPRLGLWGKGTAFPDRKSFIDQISNGGVAAMEKVAGDMKAMGMYLARNISFNDGTPEGTVEFDRITHELTGDQSEIYDRMSEAWQRVFKRIGDALELTGGESGPAKRNAIGQFWSANQRFWNQVVTAMMVPSMIKSIERDMAEGRSAIVQLTSTNEAATDRALSKKGKDQDLDDIDTSPRYILMDFLDRSFPTQRYEEYLDDNGNTRSRPVVDSKGNPVHDPAAVAMKEQLMDEIGSMQVADRGAIDMLIDHFGEDAVAEITGRTKRILKKNGRAEMQKRSERSAAADKEAFMDGKKRILVFSEAGGTGASYHADKTRKNQQRRAHYVLQPGWRADVAVQGLGRAHRSNQASAPIIHLMQPSLNGYKRFISTIARRLSQLGALTKGQRTAGDSGVFSASDNLESTEAKAAMQKFFDDAVGGRISGIDAAYLEDRLGLTIMKSDGGMKANLPPITQFMNRVLNLPIDEQNHVFGEFQSRLDSMVEAAIANGTLDQGMETIKADSAVKTHESVVSTHPTGAETKHVVLKIKNKVEPRTWDELQKAGKDKLIDYVQSQATGKIFGVVDLNQTEQDSQGRMRKLVRLVGIGGTSRNDTTNLKDAGNWTVLSKSDAKKAWDSEVEAFPGVIEKEIHLLTGALLPVWDRLPEGNAKVRRILTDDGEQILGREIDKSDIKKTLRRLGADYQTETVTPEQALTAIDAGALVELSNGWVLKQSRVEGETLNELVGPDFRYNAELKVAGAFSRRVDYKVRWFIPTGKSALTVLNDILANNRQIVEVHEPKEKPRRLGGSNAKLNAASSSDRKSYFGRRSGPVAAAAPVASKSAKTDGGKSLVAAIESDIKNGKRSVGRRSIGEFLNRTFNAQMLVTSSQTTRNNPAVFREDGAMVFSRSGTWDINIHEAGHAMDAMIQDDNPLWYQQHEQELENLASSRADAPFASDGTASEGIAELVRKFVTSDGDNHPLMQSFVDMLRNESPRSLDALEDARIAYALHASRPYVDQRAADRYDVAKDANNSKTKVADAFWALANQVIGNSTLIHRRKRQLWRSITGESKASMIDPTGVIGSMGLMFSSHARAVKQVAKEVMNTIEDNRGDISRAYSRKLGADAVKLQAMQGSGLHVYVNGSGLRSLTKRQILRLRRAGFPLPSKFAKDGEVQQITDKSFEQIKLAIGDGKQWEDFQTAVFDRVASERHRKSGHVYPGMADGITPDMLDAQWQKAFADNPEWENHFRDLERFMNQTLLLGLMGGQYTVSEVVDMVTKWDAYAPLQRQVENRTGGRGSGRSSPDFGARRAKGSHLEYRDMEDSIRDRVSQAVDAYHDNMMILAVRDESRILGRDKRLSYEVRKGIERTMVPLNMDPTVVARLSPDEQYDIIAKGINRIELDRLGIDHSRMSDDKVNEALENEGIMPMTSADVTVAIPGQPARLIRGRKRPDLPRVVAPWENGTRKYYLVNDPLMFSLFANSGDSIGWVRSVNNLLNGIAAPWKRAYTSSFKFLIRSFLRDPVTAAFLAERKREMIPGYYLATAMIGRITGNDFSKEARASAELMTQALDATTNHTHQTYLGQFLGVLKEGVFIKGWSSMPLVDKAIAAPGQAMSAILKPVDVLNYVTGARYLSQQMEVLGREGAYIRERKLGRSPAKAQERFMKASGFFAQRQANKSLAGFIRTAGFLNPALQILWQNYEAITNPNPSRRLVLNGTRAAYLTSIAATASAINFALITLMYGDDEEELEAVLDNMRERDRMERLGNAALMGWFRMPFDYGPAGSLMSAAWNEVEEYLLGVKVDRYKRAIELAERAASLPGFDDLIPPMPKTVVEQVRNKTFYTGREIVPSHMLERYADNPQLQYYWDTPELYRSIGNMTNTSPLRIEHAVRGITTAIYDDTARFASEVSQGRADVKNFPIWRGLTVNKVTGSRSLSVRSLEELDAEYKMLDTALKQDGSLSEAKRQEYAERRKTLAMAHAVTNQVSDIRDQIRDERNKEQPDYEKIASMENRMIGIASDFVNDDRVDLSLLEEDFKSEKAKLTRFKGKPGKGYPEKPDRPKASRLGNPKAWAEYERELSSYEKRVKDFEHAQGRARDFVEQYNVRR